VVAGTLRHRRILRRQVRKLVRAYLEEDNEFCVCCEAIDGLDAINKAKDSKPDLIIFDASMPHMNGIEAAPKLKELLPETAIILFTFHEGTMRGFDSVKWASMR